MAVSKIWKVTVRLDQVIDYATNPEKTAAKQYSPEQYQALADVLQYAKDEEKTEREFYVGGINCNASTARDQFVTVKEQFDKCDGIQAYHGYLSFKDEPNITPELAQQIGTEFAKRVWGDRFQVVVTTHLNTKRLHCHFVVNSVSFVDGKRMQNNEKHWRYFRHIADELCRQHQLDVIENPKRGTGKNYYARKLHEAGMPNYVDSAKAVIDEAISKSNSYADFKYILRQMGATFDDSPNHKYQVLRVKGYQKNIRLTRLGDDYSLDRIKERIYENRNRVRLEPFQKGYYYRPKQYVLLTREHKIRKVGGLYGLYLHYCYKLGYLPKYQKQNPARLHYLLREDLMKLDQITAQVRLLGREHISTSEQLFSYKSKVEDEIKTLTADRTHLRNEIRKVNIDDDLLSGKRQQISALSERLKELRKEVRLCDGIAERSGVMRCLQMKKKSRTTERRTVIMNTGGDAAEQVVRLSLEGFEVAAKLTGTAAKELTVLLVSVLKQEQKTKGKARLTNMLKSGKELKVFSVPNKDLKKFTEQAKKYGVLYCVLRDKYSKDDNAPVDIIARAEDASKIQRIFDRFELGNVDKGSIVANAEKSIAQREELANEVPTKSKGERIVEEAMGKPIQKDGASHENPTVAKTDKNPPSRQSSAEVDGKSDKGISKSAEEKPSVREKLERYKAQAKTEKEADRTDLDKSGEKPKSQTRTNQTTHQQPKKKKNRNKNKAR